MIISSPEAISKASERVVSSKAMLSVFPSTDSMIVFSVPLLDSTSPSGLVVVAKL